jgi:hypothetical protein
LGLSSFDEQPAGASDENLQLMRWIDEQYTKTPFYGVRQITAWLKSLGYTVNPKRVRRLMRQMGLMTLFPKPKTSTPGDTAPIPVSAPFSRHRQTESGLEYRYHLISLDPWLCLSVCDSRRVFSLRGLLGEDVLLCFSAHQLDAGGMQIEAKNPKIRS